MYIYHILLIHSSINGYLGYFHLLTIVNNAAMNMGVQISQDPAWYLLGDGILPRDGIAGS